MEKIVDLVTSYPVPFEYILDFLILLVFTGLVCLYLIRAGKLWKKILELTITTCGGILFNLKKGHPTLLELNIIDSMSSAISEWKVARSLNATGTKTIDLYLEGRHCHLSTIEKVYSMGRNVGEESTINAPFDAISSALWRYNWLDSKVFLLATLYMEITRLFSLKKGSVFKLYAKIRRDVKEKTYE